jgi:hypothetical protein
VHAQTFSNLNDELGLALVPTDDGSGYVVRPWAVVLNMATVILGMIAIALLTAALTNSSSHHASAAVPPVPSVEVHVAVAGARADAVLEGLAGDAEAVRALGSSGPQAQVVADRALTRTLDWLLAEPAVVRLPRYKLTYLVSDILHPLAGAGAVSLPAVVAVLRRRHPELDAGTKNGVSIGARLRDAWAAISNRSH